MNDATLREPIAPCARRPRRRGRGGHAGRGRAGAPRRKLRPLLGLTPFVARYKGRAAAALGALLVASLATLAVPLAVRRMIDFGFSAERIGLIDQYFAVMIAVVAVLAVASASRYYLVTTLGERVVADLRRGGVRAAHPAVDGFLRHRQVGRAGVAAHRRHHPDQVGGRRLGVGRAAQPRAVLRLRHHDGGDEPAAFAVRAGRDSGDRAAAGRVRPRWCGGARAPRRTRSPTPPPMRPS